MPKTPGGAIVIRGARQNNLKNLTLELPHNELTVVTGVSGSGKSSLVFDTLYAERQRRYVETFSPYRYRGSGLPSCISAGNRLPRHLVFYAISQARPRPPHSPKPQDRCRDLNATLTRLRGDSLEHGSKPNT